MLGEQRGDEKHGHSLYPDPPRPIGRTSSSQARSTTGRPKLKRMANRGNQKGIGKQGGKIMRYRIIDKSGAVIAMAQSKADAFFVAEKHDAKHIYDNQADKYLPFDFGTWSDYQRAQRLSLAG